MAIKGLHVPANFTEAREHFEAAAARDLPSALNGLGACLLPSAVICCRPEHQAGSLLPLRV